jgi:hypothetical protein
MTHTKFRRQLEWKLNQNFQSSAGVKRGHPSTSDQEMDGHMAHPMTINKVCAVQSN